MQEYNGLANTAIFKKTYLHREQVLQIPITFRRGIEDVLFNALATLLDCIE